MTVENLSIASFCLKSENESPWKPERDNTGGVFTLRGPAATCSSHGNYDVHFYKDEGEDEGPFYTRRVNVTVISTYSFENM